MKKLTLGKGEKILFIVLFILFVLYSAMLIYPLAWGLMSSFKTLDEYFDSPFSFPAMPQFGNYPLALETITDGGFSFLGMFWNSFWFAGGSAFINMEFVALFSYVLNKFRFRGRNFLYGLCLFMMSVPIGATLMSTYKLYHQLKLVDSYLILFTATNVYGMNLILFHSYWGNISRSYAEAAQMDGAGYWQTYFKVMLPQAVPMMLTLGVLMFISKWNDYMAPLLYLPNMPTLATGLFRYQTVVERSGDYPVLFAALILCLIPVLIIFAIFSDKLMQNMSIGGLKG